MPRRVLGYALVFFGLSAASPALASGLYNVTNFGATDVRDINNNGDVVLAHGVYHSYGPDAGKVTTRSEYGLPADATFTSINDHGAVAGQVDRPDGGRDAFVVQQGGTPVYVPRLPGQTSASGTTVNNAGDVGGTAYIRGTGASYYPGGPERFTGFMFQNGNVTDLDPTIAHPYFHLTELNNSGQLVGWENMPLLNQTHGVLYQNGGLTDLGTLGGTQSHAAGINDQGQVVGTSSLAGPKFNEHGFLYQNGVMTDLGALSGPDGRSGAFGINNLGDVVGDSDGTAVLWKNGGILDLSKALTSPLPYELSWAYKINDLGQIIGMGYDPETRSYDKAFLLTPTDLPPAAAFTPYVATPEPGTWALFGVLGLGCLWRRRGSR